MTETTIRPYDAEEALFATDISDQALETAANGGLHVGAYTVSFCTGLDSCPAVPAA